MDCLISIKHKKKVISSESMDIYVHTKYKTGKHGKLNGNIKIMPRIGLLVQEISSKMWPNRAYLLVSMELCIMKLHHKWNIFRY